MHSAPVILSYSAIIGDHSMFLSTWEMGWVIACGPFVPLDHCSHVKAFQRPVWNGLVGSVQFLAGWGPLHRSHHQN